MKNTVVNEAVCIAGVCWRLLRMAATPPSPGICCFGAMATACSHKYACAGCLLCQISFHWESSNSAFGIHLGCWNIPYINHQELSIIMTSPLSWTWMAIYQSSWTINSQELWITIDFPSWTIQKPFRNHHKPSITINYPLKTTSLMWKTNSFHRKAGTKQGGSTILEAHPGYLVHISPLPLVAPGPSPKEKLLETLCLAGLNEQRWVLKAGLIVLLWWSMMVNDGCFYDG